ncbi:carboxypeptidase regulatory-like domain-containing protein [Nocardioides sp. SLBN-35]|uniref:carboxypeptidase regulatory-like domain-containing protein n=1 Tax=Nocardioides sp. SLBN-35 TaxID=2768445 RepID=UPI00114DC3F4|nr:carboxypeptidase regulatory-like domain-containing protein [Nocardioides sp. SLBN-35]TQK70057.1 PKD repeat protein [Nocardioides sp. SLBN-35]
MSTATARRILAVVCSLLLTLGLGASLSAPAAAAAAPADVPGTISGTVTDADTGGALAGIQVIAWCHYDDDGDGYPYWDWCWDAVTEDSVTTLTGSDGSYQLAVPAGTYRIGFEDPQQRYLTSYHPQADRVGEADDLLVAAGALVPGIDAALHRGGLIAGTLTSSDGQPLAEADVEVYRENDGDLAYDEYYGYTEEDGSYSVGPLPDGEYRVGFFAWDHVSEYYDDRSSLQAADPLTVADAATLTADAVLSPGASISGVVTDETAAPLEDIQVRLYEYDADYDYWDWTRSTSTDAEGRYALRRLTPGTTYRVGFSAYDGAHVREFYDDEQSVEQATDIVLADEQQFTASAALARGGRISGQVSGADGEPLSDISVEVYREVSGEVVAEEFYGYTDENGSYEVGGLPDGDYRVAFLPWDDIHASEYYDDQPTLAQAEVLHLAGGSSVVADAELGLRGSITGQVTDEDGTPLGGISVQLHTGVPGGDDGGSTSCCWETEADGRYRIPVDPGRYALEFEDHSGVHVSEFYDDQPSLEQATGVVVAGDETVVADARLALGSSVTGTVTAQGGMPLGDTSVTVYRYEPVYDYWYWWDSTHTDAQGHYAIGDLTPSTPYRLRFHATDGQHVDEYFDDRTSLEEATDIVLGEHETFTADAELSTAGRVTGTIRDEAGDLLGDVSVSVYRQATTGDDWSWAGNAWSSDGNYAVGGLGSGTYRVEFAPSDGLHGTEQYDDVSVVVGQDTTVDAVLELRYGAISGVVSDDSGPLAGIWVSAQSSGAYRSALTDEDGRYRIDQLPPADYLLYFDVSNEDFHSPEYYDDAEGYDQATPVAVTLGATATADASLAVVGGALAGTVRDPDGTPLRGATAILYRDDGGSWNSVAWSSTDFEGRYRFRRQPEGTYRVGLAPNDDVHLAAFHGGADLAGASDVVLRLGEVTTIETSLPVGAAISGVVTGSASEPLEDVGVTAYRVDPDTGAPEALLTRYTSADGTFRIGALPAGTYRVGYRLEETHAAEYFDDAGSLGDAEDLVLALGQTGTANAVLAPRIENLTPPTIQGVARIGEPLSVDVGTWSYPDASYTYQWYRNGSVLSSATGSTYTPTNDNAWFYGTDLDAQISVRVTATKLGHLPREAWAAAVGPVQKGIITHLTPPAISGTVRVGETLSVAGDTWQPGSVSRSYTWLRDGQPTGVTGTSYPLAAADLGARISVRTTVAKDAYVTTSQDSAETDPVALGVIDNLSPATVTGIPRSGETLTADVGSWRPAEVTPEYRWLRDGEPVAGATGPTYLLTEADATHRVAVEVTATKTAYAPTSSTSPQSARVTHGLIAATTSPSVSGVTRVGEELSVDPGTWNTADLSLAYQWLRDGEPIGATGATYRLRAADLEHRISVRIDATRADYDPGFATTAEVGPIAPGQFTSVAAPAVEGTPQVGVRLTIAGNGWDPTPEETAYQWLRDGTPIAGATGTSYVPGPVDVDGRIAVEVSVSSDAYEPAVLRSVESAPVALGALDNTAVPEVSGTARVGETLSATAGGWAPDGVTTTYQWRRDGAPIPGATAATYPLVPADANARITVAVTATLAGYAPAESASAATAPVTYDVVANVTRPTVTGTARVGETLSATDGTWTPTGTTPAFQWLRDGTPIPGATARTRVLRAADLGARISVEVTASRDQYDPARATSEETVAVTPGALANVTAPTILGSTRVERTLTVDPGTWAPVSVEGYAYQWLRDGSAIDGATDATYVLTDDDLDAEIGLRVTASKAGYDSATATAPPTSAIRPADHAPTVEVTVAPGLTGAAPYAARIEIAADDPEHDPLTYRVEPGDGSGALTGGIVEPVQAVDHVFATVGSFAVRVLVSDGENTTTRIVRVTSLLPEPLVAVGGEPVAAVAGTPVTLDAGASRPAALIDSYEWDFGDGAHGSGVAARHTYASAGTFPVTLTVTAGTEVATATTTVTVSKTPVTPGLQVTIRDGDALLSGAQASVRMPDGTRISGVTDGSGGMTLHGLPDGSTAVDVWAPGYLPATVTATLSDGGGSLDVSLVRGDVGSAVLESHPLTLDELWDRGIDLDAAENQHIFEAEIRLHFVVEEPDEPGTYQPQSLPVTLTAVEGGGYYLGCSGGCPGGGGGGGGSLVLGGSTYTPRITVVEGAPIIEWLVIPVRGSWAKEFFDVSMIVQNLGTGGATFRPGLATLDLPSGLALATTWDGQQQTLTRTVPAIPAGGSQTISWTVRGDEEGFYDLEATYDSVLDPFDAPLTLVARSEHPLHVWAGSALTLSVTVDGEVERWMPYRVTTTLTNSTCAAIGPGCDEVGPTLYNVRLALGERPENAPADQARYVYGPNEQTQDAAMILPPGASVQVDTIVMPGIGTDDDDPAGAPIGDVEAIKEKVVRVMQLDTAQSMLTQTAGTPINIDDEIHVHDGLTPHTRLDIDKVDDGAEERIELDWDPVSLPGKTVTGYRVYTRDSLTGGSWRVLPAGVSSTTWPAGTTQASYPLGTPGLGGYFTVIAVYAGGTLATHRLVFGPAKYVALGDSFSAGEGVPEFSAGSATDIDSTGGPATWEKAWALVTGDQAGNTCHRSSRGSYSRLLSAEPELSSWLAPARFAACSGAVTKDLVEPNPDNENEPAQTDSLSEATRAVTMTMGGNDADFGGIIKACLNPLQSCAADLYGNSGVRWEWLARTEVELNKGFDVVTSAADVLAECPLETASVIGMAKCGMAIRDYYLALKRATGDRDRDASALFVYADVLRKRLEASYEKVLAEAPNATLYVADYPRQLSAGRASKACEVTPFGDLSVIDPVEGVLLNGFVDQLNEEIAEALENVRARHPDRSVIYVPVAEEFAGHELCVDGELNPDSAFNPLINDVLSWPDAYGKVAYSFHPNALGQELYRDAFRQAMTGQTRKLVEMETSSITPAQSEVPPFTDGVVARVRHAEVTPVAISLLGPDGQVVHAGDPGTTSGDENGVTWLRLADPAPGLWRVEVELADPAPAAKGASERGLLATALAADEPVAPTLVEVELSVEASPDAPVASATLTGPTSGSYRFDASGSHGRGDEQLSVDWLFADGATATGRVVDHAFAAGIEPSALLTVTTADGRSASVDVTLAPPPAPALVPVGDPSVTADVAEGDPVVPGVVLTASGDWIPQPAGTTFRWLRDGDPISGATASTYRVTAQDAGHALRVEITASREGFEPGEARSAALAVPEEPVEPTVTNTVLPVISGTPAVGQTLTVSPGSWTPADVVLSYAWFAGASPIPGASGPTATSLLLTAAQQDAVITVRVTATVGDVSQAVTTVGTPAVRAAGGGGGGVGPTAGPGSAACTAATQALSTAQAVLADVSQRLKSAKAKLKKARKARRTAQVTKLKKKVAKLKKSRTAAHATVTTALGSVGSAC